ncbi:hypothetical protein LTS12_016420 [Elasticomyces elasticus]|nr:hypothetical protein LTS12_016420 [Elasticomyces elasticus]
MEVATAPMSNNTGSTLSAWPGERDPTRHDVDNATNVPEAAFMDGFALALLHSEGPDREDVSWMLENSANDDAEPSQTCTYPMALLSDVPALPSDGDLMRSASAFSSTFRKHVFLSTLKWDWYVPDTAPPYLELALACMACASESRSRLVEQHLDVAGDIFRCGVSLWPVMVEVDNRLARSLDAVIAVRGLESLSKLHRLTKIFRQSYYPLTVVCLRKDFIGRELRECCVMWLRALISYMLLIDVVQAIHFDSIPNYSTNELFIDMPASQYPFRKIYGSLIGGHPLPLDVNAHEDAILLVIALLADIVRAQKNGFPRVSMQSTAAGRRPLPPLTLAHEVARTEAALAAALARWKKHFVHAPADVLGLCHIAELRVLCPSMNNLPRLAGYPDTGTPSKVLAGWYISDQAVDVAWQVLGDSESCSAGSASYESVWLPIAVFLAALVVWKHLDKKSLKQGLSSARALTMFINELERLRWPCCTAMIATLKSLTVVSS